MSCTSWSCRLPPLSQWRRSAPGPCGSRTPAAGRATTSWAATCPGRRRVIDRGCYYNETRSQHSPNRFPGFRTYPNLVAVSGRAGAWSCRAAGSLPRHPCSTESQPLCRLSAGTSIRSSWTTMLESQSASSLGGMAGTSGGSSPRMHCAPRMEPTRNCSGWEFIVHWIVGTFVLAVLKCRGKYQNCIVCGIHMHQKFEAGRFVTQAVFQPFGPILGRRPDRKLYRRLYLANVSVCSSED